MIVGLFVKELKNVLGSPISTMKFAFFLKLVPTLIMIHYSFLGKKIVNMTKDMVRIFSVISILILLIYFGFFVNFLYTCKIV